MTKKRAPFSATVQTESGKKSLWKDILQIETGEIERNRRVGAQREPANEMLN